MKRRTLHLDGSVNMLSRWVFVIAVLAMLFVSLLATTPSRLVRLVDPAAASSRPLYIQVFRTFSGEDGHIRQFRHPSRFRVDAEDSTVTFMRLRWRGWGKRRAVARGRARTCDLLSGECQTHRVRLVADGMVGCVRYRLYGRVVARGIPLYGHRVELPTLHECNE